MFSHVLLGLKSFSSKEPLQISPLSPNYRQEMKLNLSIADSKHDSTVLHTAWNSTGTYFLSVNETGDIKKFNERGQYQEDFALALSNSSLVNSSQSSIHRNEKATIVLVATCFGVNMNGFIFGDDQGNLSLSLPKNT